MKRVVIALGLLLGLAAKGHTNQAIILIGHDAVSRAVSPESYNHDLWIRWPSPTGPGASNLLPSVTTGLDWSIPATPVQFKKVGQSYVSPTGNGLSQTGYFEARRTALGETEVIAVADAMGATADPSLFLALGKSGVVHPYPFGVSLPHDSLAVYSAQSWDDAAKLTKLVGGRSIILEYPPDIGQAVSAAWLVGPGWPEGFPSGRGTGIPGLLPASEVLRLLGNPKAYKWSNESPAEAPSAQRWMQTVTATAPYHQAGALIVTLIVVVASLYGISRQAASRPLRILLAGSLLAVPALLWAGNFARFFGLRPWNALPFIAAATLTVLLVPGYLGLRAIWPKAPPLFGLFALLVPLILVAEPDWTVLSPVLSESPTTFSPLGWGVLTAALVGLVSFSLEGGLGPRLVASILLLAVQLGTVLHLGWFHGPDMLRIMPILCLLAGSGALKLSVLPLSVLWPFLYARWNFRFAWNPNGMLSEYLDLNAINLAGHARFLLSPVLLTTLGITVAASLWGGAFLRHELRRTFLSNPACRRLLLAGLATASMGLREPQMLYVGLFVCVVGLIVLLFDTAGAL